MLELVILSTLMTGPCHGYLFKAYRGAKVNNNTIYPLLKKLSDLGYISSTLVQQDDKPAKKVYTITEPGKQRMFELLKDFDASKAVNDDEFYLRVAYLQELDKKSIAKILNARLEALARMEGVSVFEDVLSPTLDKNRDRVNLKNFIHSQHLSEKKFIEMLKQRYEVE